MNEYESFEKCVVDDTPRDMSEYENMTDEEIDNLFKELFG